MNKGRKKWEILSPSPSQHEEMEWLSHAISGSPWQSSELNPGADFQAKFALFANPSYQPKAEEVRSATWGDPTPMSRARPRSALCRGARDPCWDKDRVPFGCPWVLQGRILQHSPWHITCGLRATPELVLTQLGQHNQCWCDVNSVTPNLPRAPSQTMASSQVAPLGPRGKKTWRALLGVAWREQRNKVRCSWEPTKCGEISQTWQECCFIKWKKKIGVLINFLNFKEFVWLSERSCFPHTWKTI